MRAFFSAGDRTDCTDWEVRKTHLFILKMYHFTKTGFGQTWGKHSKQRDVCGFLHTAVRWDKCWARHALRTRKRVFLRRFILKTIILPRQARDKHRESTQKTPPFSQVTSFYWAITAISTVGFGDISGQTDKERIFSVIIEIFGTSAQKRLFLELRCQFCSGDTQEPSIDLPRQARDKRRES
eukprot:COSAG06_NODE_429_length_15872_cov_25.578330_20_plen_182_part_00